VVGVRSIPIALLLGFVACGARSELYAVPGNAANAGADATDEGVADAVDEAAVEIDATLCLERPLADCTCTGGACDPGSTLNGAIFAALSGCVVPCTKNLLWFSVDGCVTRYEPPSSSSPPDDVCVEQALTQVRFPCTSGVTEPFLLYNLSGHCGS
jgi:hypothetical protein